MNNSDCFREYPDILTIEQLMEMLHIGRNSAYSMLKDGLIKTIKVGKKLQLFSCELSVRCRKFLCFFQYNQSYD